MITLREGLMLSQRKIPGAVADVLAMAPRHRELLLLRLLSMPDEFSAIPLADVLRAANELVSAGLIKDYALGGALAAIYYTEPISTYDADIIFVASDKILSAGIPAIYSHLQLKGWRVEHEHRNWKFPGAISRCIRIN